MYSLLQICLYRKDFSKKQKKKKKKKKDKLNAYSEYALSTGFLVEALFL